MGRHWPGLDAQLRKDKHHDEENFVDGKFTGPDTDSNIAVIFGIIPGESE